MEAVYIVWEAMYIVYVDYGAGAVSTEKERKGNSKRLFVVVVLKVLI